MNREKITILFVINTNKTNQKGLCPMSCRKIHSANTINKIIQRLRTSIKQAISEAYLDRDPLIIIQIKKSTQRGYIPQDNEINLPRHKMNTTNN
jgi:hypothetical protein